jgi:hypothetical protein
MNKRAALVTTGLAAALALAPVTSAHAAPKPQVNFSGLGTHTVTSEGNAIADGTATGIPFNGSFHAALQPLDGTLPDPGVCEDGHASIRIDGARGKYAVLIGNGRICGQYLQPPFVVTQVFTGRYDVASTSERKLRGGDGWFEIRLTNDGRAAVTAFDS